MKLDNASEVMQLAWETSPIGAVVINEGGVVCAVNPAVKSHLGFGEVSVIGMSEADFVSRLDTNLFEHRRTKATQIGLRAIHYLHVIDNQSQPVKDNFKKIAEELREPLASIYGFAELLLTQNYDADIRQNLTATLLEQVELLSNIINESLDESKSNRTEQHGFM
jgi:signal transduction histidine kinase